MTSLIKRYKTSDKKSNHKNKKLFFFSLNPPSGESGASAFIYSLPATCAFPPDFCPFGGRSQPADFRQFSQS